MPDLDQIKQAEQGRGTGADAPPSFRERTVKFAPANQESSPREEAHEPEARDIAPAMKAVTSALAGGVITPGEAGTIAAVVDVFSGRSRRVTSNPARRRPRTASPGTRARPRGLASGGALNCQMRFFCRFAAGAANAQSWDNCWLRPGTVGAAA